MKTKLDMTILILIIATIMMASASAEGPVINDVYVLEPDRFYSPNPGNNIINLIANVSNINLGGMPNDVLQANFSNLTTSCGTSGIIDMTLDTAGVGWNLYSASCDVASDAQDSYFLGGYITVAAVNASMMPAPDAMDIYAFQPIILYNMTVPPEHPEFPCWALGEGTTDLSAELDFNDVNFIYELMLNGSEGCYYPGSGLPWGNTLKTVITLDFASVDFTNESIGEKLSILADAIKVNVTGPGRHGDSIVEVNSSAFGELDTATTITIYGLPFTAAPAISGTQGVSGITYVLDDDPYPGGYAKGNLTFTVDGFSGYVIGDSVDPIIEIQTPLAQTYNDAPEYINMSINGTGTQISYAEVRLNGNLIWNATDDEIYNSSNPNYPKDCSIPNAASLDFIQCNISLAGNFSSYGTYNLSVAAFDFGGDAPGNRGDSSVAFNYSMPNVAPVASNGSFAIAEGSSYSGAAIATDANDDTLTYSIVTTPARGTLTFNTDGSFSYSAHRQPTVGFVASDSFTFRAYDGELFSNTANITVSITPVNDAPVVYHKSFNVNLGDSYSGNVSGTDIDGDALTYTSVTEPALGTLTFNADGTFTYAANSGQSGIDNFVFRASDGLADSNNANVTINVESLFCGGTGTEATPYMICDADQLNATRRNLTAHYRLSNSINMDVAPYNTGSGWEPIGNESGFDPSLGYLDAFSGTFDGNGYIISNLYINRPTEFHVGLFGHMRNSAEIKNVGIVNADVTGGRYVGALVGDGNVDIENSYSTGTVYGDMYIGGLVGQLNGDITNSYSSADVTRTTYASTTLYAGGLLGYLSYGSIADNCYATGNVLGRDYVGGFAGYNSGGFIYNSYSTGDVTGRQRIGGFVGQQTIVNDGGAIIQYSYATGTVTATASDSQYSGGFIGYQYSGYISRSYATGNVNGRTESGGFAGRDIASINDSYATGNSSGIDYIGGFVGRLGGTISNTYSVGHVSGTTNVGGLIGGLYGASHSINDSYYDADTSNQDDDGRGEPKTTAELKAIATFASWNIASTTTVFNNGYPFLAWQDDRDDYVWLIYVEPAQEEETPRRSSGGSGGGTVNFFGVADQMLKSGVTKNLGKGQGLRFRINLQNHLLRIDDISLGRATVTVMSTPQTKTLAVGEEWYVDVDGDGQYDIIVKVSEIRNNQAFIDLKAATEEMTQETGADDAIPDSTDTSIDVTGDTSIETGQDAELPIEQPQTDTTTSDTDDTLPAADSTEKDEKTSKSKVWLWILIIAVIIAIGSNIYNRNKRSSKVQARH